MKEKISKILPIILTSMFFTFLMPMSVVAMTSFTYDTYYDYSSDASEWSYRRYHHDDTWVVGITKYYGADASVDVPSIYDALGAAVDVIDDGTFKDNTNIENVIIPEGVEYIGDYAFSGCTNLKSITIPESVIAIGEGAFENCGKLTSITIPESVSNIEASTFSGCSSLAGIELPDGITSIGSEAFKACSNLESIVIPDGINSISEEMFSGCSSLTSISLSDDISSIGAGAFDGCSSLKSFVIPSGVTELNQYLFSDCSSLSSIVIPEGVTTIGHSEWSGGVFQNCRSLTRISIPDSVKEIGYFAFSGCTGLKSISLPKGLETIGSYAFQKCTGFTEFTIPDSLTHMDSYVFDGCKNLSKISCPADYAYDICYRNEIIKEVNITSGKSIEAWTFYGTQNLSKVSLAASVTSIGNCAFSICPATIYYAASRNNWNKIEGSDLIDNTVICAVKETPKVTVPTSRSLSYTGKNQSLINAGKTTGGTMKYSLTKNGTYSTKIPTAKNIGSYTVYYRVYGGNDYNSTGAKAITVKIVPKVGVISSLTNKVSKTILVKWAKNSTSTGYQIQYAVSSKFNGAKTVTITKNSIVTRKLTKLTKGKTYYVRMRNYKTVSGSKLYSSWSKARKLKVKR